MTRGNSLVGVAKSIYEDMQLYESLPDGDGSKYGTLRKIMNACNKLSASLIPPDLHLSRVGTRNFACVATSIALDLDIPHHIPLKGSVTLEELARCTKASPRLLQYVMSLLTEQQIFETVSTNTYRHNLVSLTLRETDIASWVHYLVEDGLRISAYLSEQLAETGYQFPAEDPQKAAFSRAFNTDKTFYEYYAKVERVRGERFAKGQEWNAKNDALESMFSFQNVRKNATVVDVGGGRGQNSLRLLRKFDHLQFIVQDDPSVVDSLKTNPLALTEEEKSRIRWQGHNIFGAQPVKGADIYLINNVFEDSSDESAQKVIRNVVDAMQPGVSKCVVFGWVLPEEGEIKPYVAELMLHLFSISNQPGRTGSELAKVLQGADERLSLVKTYSQGSAAIVFEFTRRA